MNDFLAAALATTLAAGLAACSPEPSPQPSLAPSEAAATVPEASVQEEGASASPTPMAMPVADRKVLGLEGLGDLRIGQPVPAGSGWKKDAAQASDTCLTYTSPDHPGAYAIVERGAVRRITIGQRSDVKLAEGIAAGASEAEVKRAFPSFRAEPHAYQEPPAKYLTAPNAPGGDSALRFEIGSDGKVELIHVGTMPVLGYVEACA